MMPYNLPVLLLYQEVADQLIVGPSGAIGLDFRAVDLIMERLSIAEHERIHFWRKLKIVSGEVRKLLQEKAERERKLSQAKSKARSGGARRR